MNIVLKNGLLIDGTGREPVPNASLVIKEGRIKKVGALSPDELSHYESDDMRVIDLGGKTLMPGLINVHQHFDNRWGRGSYQERAQQPITWLLLRGVRNALLDLCEGVTTVRDLGSKRGTSLTIKKAIAEGMLVGPRVLTCGQPISMTGGHGWELCIEADGEDQVRKAARQLLKAGADVIKVMASGGNVDQTKDRPWSSQLSQSEIRVAFEEAAKAGKKTTAHAHPPAAIRAAIAAGTHCVEHGGLIDRETAELMAEKGIFLVPTLGEGWEIAHRGKELGRPEWLSQVYLKNHDARIARFGTAVEAGVKIAVGTDVAGSMALEMALIHRGGLGAMDTIVAATRNGAELCDLQDVTGTLEAGKYADVIVVDGNPAENIKDVANVELVVKEGTLYRPAELRSAVGVWPL